jgi:hypothetical protein
MRITLQLVTHAEDGREQSVEEIVILEKDCQRIEHPGLTLSEAKQLLKQLQQLLLTHQLAALLETRSRCETGGDSLRINGQHIRTFHTLFGTVTLDSPRLHHCRSQGCNTTTFRALPPSSSRRPPRACIHGDQMGVLGLVWLNG